MASSSSSESKERRFLQSCRATENHFQSLDDFHSWLKGFEEKISFIVDPIPFIGCAGWSFDPETGDLGHQSGKFFSVQGLDVRITPEPERTWQQPVINQPEIGILGIVAKRFDGVLHFLMQAKAEPGNVRPFQLSPTLQATKSNYTRVHQGKLPLYLEYFVDRSRSEILVDRLQSEQGARFFKKRNRNMIVEVQDDIPVHDHFIWLTLHDIKQLLRVPNFVNMDARSVLACISLADPDGDGGFGPVGGRCFASLLDRDWDDLDQVLSWFTERKALDEVHARFMPLHRVEGWIHTDSSIQHESGDFFSVMAVHVEIGGREVSAWSQPLIAHPHTGVIGYLVREVNGAYEFLVQAKIEPGNFDTVELAPTVSCSSPERGRKRPDLYPFLDAFLDAPDESILFDTLQSEEGGRFYQVQNRYMVVEGSEVGDIPPDYRWMTLGQIVELTRHANYFNVEARSLLACMLSLME